MVKAKGGPKGNRGEAEAVGVLRRLWPQAHRGKQKSGAGVPGSALHPDGDGTPLWAEIKRYAAQVKYSMYFREATEKRNINGSDRPVAILGRVDRDDWMIHMRLEDFIDLMLAERGEDE